MAIWLLSTYQKLSPFVREHIAPASAVISVFVAILVGGVATFTNVNSLRMMTRQQEQIDAGQYQQYQGSVALAWRTIGEANGKAFEVGQSASLYYLAQSDELPGNVTLNRSYLSLTNTRVQQLDTQVPHYFDLTKSSFCGTEIVKLPLKDRTIARASFSYSFMRNATLQGWFRSDDLLAADLQEARFINSRADNVRLAAADLRKVVFSGGLFRDADFQGADLRGVRTERGNVGAGSEQDDGSYYDTYSYEGGTKIEWPSLFDPQKGLNEVLATLGQSTYTEGGSYLVDFSNSNFHAADLRGAHLQNSNISQSQANQACADESTELPTGRTVTPCQFPLQFNEKLNAIRTPLRQNLLERSCADALQN